MAAAARPTRPAKPTCMLLRAELGVVLGEVTALVAVAERLLVEAEDAEARLVVAGAVAELSAEEMAEEAETAAELETSATLEETATLLEDAEATAEDWETCEAVAEPLAAPLVEALPPRQLESELVWMVTGAE